MGKIKQIDLILTDNKHTILEELKIFFNRVYTLNEGKQRVYELRVTALENTITKNSTTKYFNIFGLIIKHLLSQRFFNYAKKFKHLLKVTFKLNSAN